ncbi:MAG: hypothetical protein SWH61_02465 [Thermodesulfobacteriota bacterium]|nr:hypothetical protein [Thermodesulfobacteriota bacterium]
MKNSSLLIAGIMVLLLSGHAFAQQGMMHEGYGPGMMQQEYRNTDVSRESVDKDQAEAILKDYLDTVGSQNLKPGDITDQGSFFVAEIMRKDGSLVNRMQIDKRTGRIYHYGYGYNHYGMRGDAYESGGDSDWNYCPYCGREFYHRGYGPGMMHGGGYGPGMMHRGYGPGMMMQGYGWYQKGREPGEPMDKDTARQIVADYLSSNDNPNLKVGDLTEKKDSIEVKIVTKKSEDLVDIIVVDKDNGYMHSIY